MKRILFLFLLCLLQQTAVAQWSLGVHGGANSTSITRSHADRVDETYSSLCGFDLGINGRYTINPWLSLRADLSLMQRNHRLQRHLNYLSPVHTDHRNTYLTLPLMVDFSFGGSKLKGHLLLGGYCGYWMGQRVSGTTYTMSDYYVFFVDFNERRDFTREDRRFNAGLSGGVALSYTLADNIALSLDALYYYDLLSHHKGYLNLQDYRYLNTLSVTLGISYQFTKKEQQ
ncbi:MAG: PorT family protein [Bacteroidales bacterium]|nr:PorT family protein [Bacteroidales bacterium]